MELTLQGFGGSGTVAISLSHLDGTECSLYPSSLGKLNLFLTPSVLHHLHFTPLILNYLQLKAISYYQVFVPAVASA